MCSQEWSEDMVSNVSHRMQSNNNFDIFVGNVSHHSRYTTCDKYVTFQQSRLWRKHCLHASREDVRQVELQSHVSLCVL